MFQKCLMVWRYSSACKWGKAYIFLVLNKGFWWPIILIDLSKKSEKIEVYFAWNKRSTFEKIGFHIWYWYLHNYHGITSSRSRGVKKIPPSKIGKYLIKWHVWSNFWEHEQKFFVLITPPKVVLDSPLGLTLLKLQRSEYKIFYI